VKRRLAEPDVNAVCRHLVFYNVTEGRLTDHAACLSRGLEMRSWWKLLVVSASSILIVSCAGEDFKPKDKDKGKDKSGASTPQDKGPNTERKAAPMTKDEFKYPDAKDPALVTTSSGLKYLDLKKGDGAEAKQGDYVSVHYTGWLKDGTKFDSSKDRGQPFSFPLGAGRVIKGWDEGVAGMKVGGKRKLIIPFELGYGSEGHPPQIPPKSELVFDVELLKAGR
jgi:FKBP-type peptidyl-prolyl cis-trans isomerase FkpA